MRYNIAEKVKKTFENSLRITTFFVGSVPFFFGIIVFPFIIKKISGLFKGKTSEKLKKFAIDMSYELTKKWYKFLFLCFGISLEVREQNYILPEKFIICANHRSFLDIPAITLSFPEKKIRFIAKEEVFSYPVIGFGMKIQEHPKVRKKISISTIREPIETIKKDYVDVLCIFPEGTRGPGSNPHDFLLEFKDGVSFLLQTLKLPVIPVALIGTHLVMPPEKIVPSPGKIKVIIGRAIETAELDELSEEKIKVGGEEVERTKEKKEEELGKKEKEEKLGKEKEDTGNGAEKNFGELGKHEKITFAISDDVEVEKNQKQEKEENKNTNGIKIKRKKMSERLRNRLLKLLRSA